MCVCACMHLKKRATLREENALPMLHVPSSWSLQLVSGPCGSMRTSTPFDSIVQEVWWRAQSQSVQPARSGDCLLHLTEVSTGSLLWMQPLPQPLAHWQTNLGAPSHILIGTVTSCQAKWPLGSGIVSLTAAALLFRGRCKNPCRGDGSKRFGQRGSLFLPCAISGRPCKPMLVGNMRPKK
mgnify:CR=1 FL=1